jgi:hypothetical protein
MDHLLLLLRPSPSPSSPSSPPPLFSSGASLTCSTPTPTLLYVTPTKHHPPASPPSVPLRLRPHSGTCDVRCAACDVYLMTLPAPPSRAPAPESPFLSPPQYARSNPTLPPLTRTRYDSPLPSPLRSSTPPPNVLTVHVSHVTRHTSHVTRLSPFACAVRCRQLYASCHGNSHRCVAETPTAHAQNSDTAVLHCLCIHSPRRCNTLEQQRRRSYCLGTHLRVQGQLMQARAMAAAAAVTLAAAT